MTLSLLSSLFNFLLYLLFYFVIDSILLVETLGALERSSELPEPRIISGIKKMFIST